MKSIRGSVADEVLRTHTGLQNALIAAGAAPDGPWSVESVTQAIWKSQASGTQAFRLDTVDAIDNLKPVTVRHALNDASFLTDEAIADVRQAHAWQGAQASSFTFHEGLPDWLSGSP